PCRPSQRLRTRDPASAHASRERGGFAPAGIVGRGRRRRERPMAMSFSERRAALAALGPHLTPDMVAGTIAIAAPDIDPANQDGVEVVKDVPYGDHERHVLDVYRPIDLRDGDRRPVIVYVHGGGFVRGAKDSESGPYFGNLGAWAVQQGWIAVVIDYRLAPAHRYPSGAEDVAAAVAWTAGNATAHGGDPDRIFL